MALDCLDYDLTDICAHRDKAPSSQPEKRSGGKRMPPIVLAPAPAVEPVSLYFDLEPGFVADLEVVSRTALAWASAIREAAYIIDPSLEVRIEVASGTPGSFSLNAWLRDVAKGLGITKEDEDLTLKAVALFVLIWMGGHALDYTFDRVADFVTGHTEGAFTDEQRSELTDIIHKAVQDKVASQRVQLVYREAERDPAIRGLGATQNAGERPAVIVPRSEFRVRAGQEADSHQETITRRHSVERVRVGLISPVLLPGTRRWRLRSSQGEFGATIKDQEFINRVLTGTTRIRMRAGIEMDVQLETTEEFRGGVWQVIERNVLHVDRLIEPPTQGDLGLPAPQYDEPDDDGD